MIEFVVLFIVSVILVDFIIMWLWYKWARKEWKRLGKRQQKLMQEHTEACLEFIEELRQKQTVMNMLHQSLEERERKQSGM